MPVNLLTLLANPGLLFVHSWANIGMLQLGDTPASFTIAMNVSCLTNNLSDYIHQIIYLKTMLYSNRLHVPEHT
jgi:hypothetical protein